jgi:Starch binding domain/Carbohydrate-binding module 48 (Isoamylase N-terminal domain)
MQIVGDCPELGSWDLEKAPALKFDGAKGAFVGSVNLPIKENQGKEWKVAVKNPYKPEQGWMWVPGPNRHLSAAPTAEKVSWITSRDGTTVINQDGYLEPHRGHLKHRYHMFTEALATIEAQGGGFDRFTRGWEYYGLTRALGGMDGNQPGIMYREWAPAAQSASLVGDFNGWDHTKHVCTKDGFVSSCCYLTISAKTVPPGLL